MKLRIVTILAVILASQFARGVSIAPEIVKQLKEQGTLQSIVKADSLARARGVWQPNPTPFRPRTAADIDTLHCLVILVDFSDMTHQAGINTTPANFDTLLFSHGVRHPGSMSDYYNETSYGMVYLTGQVTNWYRMPHPLYYYADTTRGFGQYPHNAQKLAEDAIAAADSNVDYSLYDNNGDGRVDALFIVHAGPGYEDTGNLNYIHSHAWSTTQPESLDGVIVSGYSMEPEETAAHAMIHIGVFCHEFGHVLGVPDLYDYGYDSDGVGDWSIMASGSWGGGGLTPTHFDAWSRYKLGWVVPQFVMPNLAHEQIDAVEYSPDIYELSTWGTGGPQYFLVENRQRRLFDVSIPGSGLLIYHIDETAPNNDDQTHYKVAVEQADGLFDLEHARGSNGGDPWPGTSNKRLFNDFTIPSALFYDSTITQIAVANISNSDSVMYADLEIMYIDPLYSLEGFAFYDSAGNGNGRPESGETCQLAFSAMNVRAGVDDLVVTASCSDPLVIFSDSTSSLPAAPINQIFNNGSDPIIFSMPADYESKFADFTLTFTARGGLYQQQFVTRKMLGIPRLLLVDDDAGAQIDTFYANALCSLGKSYDIWNIAVQGSPASTLAGYDYTIWFTGNTRQAAMNTEDVNALISYLDGGGRLLVSSQDFVQRLSERSAVNDTILLHQYLQVGYLSLENDHREEGQSGTVFDSMTFYSTGYGGANNQISQDALTALPGGAVLLTYRDGHTAAVGVMAGYAAMTIGFGVEGLTGAYPATYKNMSDLLSAALEYLRRPVSVSETNPLTPERFALSQNYPNPFNPTTQIAFEIPKAGQVRLEIYDIMGRLIDRPIDGILAAGSHVITWDGSHASSGIYFYRLSNGEGSQIKRMTLMK